MPNIEVFEDMDALSRAGTERFAALAQSAIQQRGRFAVALSGGHTPRTLYTLLSAPGFRDRIDWSKVHLFWGDERCVGPEDAQSNFRMVREALLSRVTLPEANVHRIRGEDEPAKAAAGYEQELRSFFHCGTSDNAASARLDLILLGLGDDAHTASLFPGTAAIDESRRWVVANWVERLSTWRITMTLPVLNAARAVCFLVSGSTKNAALEKVFGTVADRRKAPASMICPLAGQLCWMVDRAAAGSLENARLHADTSSGAQRNQFKRDAAEFAVRLVQPGMVVGLGSGSTAVFAIRRIGQLLKEGALRDIVGVPTSSAAEREALQLGIPLAVADDLAVVDLTIDGADEADLQLNCIKGGGGALLHEKIVAQASRREVIVIDEKKLSPRIGDRWPVPVEVIPFGVGHQRRYLESLGARVEVRRQADGYPYRTDEGNFILDSRFAALDDPAGLAARLAERAGIVEHGLFLGLATDLIVAGPSGIRHLIRGRNQHGEQHD